MLDSIGSQPGAPAYIQITKATNRYDRTVSQDIEFRFLSVNHVTQSIIVQICTTTQNQPFEVIGLEYRTRHIQVVETTDLSCTDIGKPRTAVEEWKKATSIHVLAPRDIDDLQLRTTGRNNLHRLVVDMKETSKINAFQFRIV